MRSKKITVTIPHRLLDAYKKHAGEAGYDSVQDMLVWCPLYSLMVGKPHSITGPISQFPRNMQDEIIETIVSAWERGEMKHGSFLERAMNEVVTNLGVNASPETVRAVIAAAIRKLKKA